MISKNEEQDTQPSENIELPNLKFNEEDYFTFKKNDNYFSQPSQKKKSSIEDFFKLPKNYFSQKKSSKTSKNKKL